MTYNNDDDARYTMIQVSQSVTESLYFSLYLSSLRVIFHCLLPLSFLSSQRVAKWCLSFSLLWNQNTWIRFVFRCHKKSNDWWWYERILFASLFRAPVFIHRILESNRMSCVVCIRVCPNLSIHTERPQPWCVFHCLKFFYIHLHH